MENVIVIGIMFVLKEFLAKNQDFKYVTKLMLDSEEEVEFRKR